MRRLALIAALLFAGCGGGGAGAGADTGTRSEPSAPGINGLSRAVQQAHGAVSNSQVQAGQSSTTDAGQ